MKNLKKLYVYENNKLILLLVNKYKDEPFIVLEQFVQKFRISDLRNTVFLDDLKTKMFDIEQKTGETFKETSKDDIALLYTPDKFILKQVEYSKEFDDVTSFNQEDVNRIINQGISQEKNKDNYILEDYKVKRYFLDNEEFNAFDKKPAKRIRIVLDLILVDKTVKNELTSLFSLINIKFNETFLIDYYFMQKLPNNSCLIDFNYEHNKVFLNIENNFQVSYLNTGMGTILEKVYEVFAKNYSPQKAEQLTRIVKKNWLLKNFNYQYDIIEDVDISVVIEVLEHVFLQYFTLLVSKLPSNPVIENIYINNNEFSGMELIDFLNSKFDYNIVPLYKKTQMITGIVNKKTISCIKKIYKEN